ncbi:uncharacterized protein [Henckelia pumila]|uniref:uncharacterized protein n=1 Tax=Henckelia pumila TaxID=405737 RepID=UPI003C6E516F
MGLYGTRRKLPLNGRYFRHLSPIPTTHRRACSHLSEKNPTGKIASAMDNESSNHRQNSANGDASDDGDPEVWAAFTANFSQVQSVLDRNRALIQQVNENHRSKIQDNLVKNVDLIQEINGNIAKVVSLYSNLSADFSSLFHQRNADGGKAEEKNNGAIDSELRERSSRDRVFSSIWSTKYCESRTKAQISALVLVPLTNLAIESRTKFSIENCGGRLTLNKWWSRTFASLLLLWSFLIGGTVDLVSSEAVYTKG